jgi:hypothetical protein
VVKDLKFIDLSPSKEHQEVLEHAGKKMRKANGFLVFWLADLPACPANK